MPRGPRNHRSHRGSEQTTATYLELQFLTVTESEQERSPVLRFVAYQRATNFLVVSHCGAGFISNALHAPPASRRRLNC